MTAFASTITLEQDLFCLTKCPSGVKEEGELLISHAELLRDLRTKIKIGIFRVFSQPTFIPLLFTQLTSFKHPFNEPEPSTMSKASLGSSGNSQSDRGSHTHRALIYNNHG